MGNSFEFGIGRLLTNSFGHIESLQVTSPQLLIETVTAILSQRIANPLLEDAPTAKLSPRLGICCLYWCQSLGRSISRVDETRVCAEALKHNLVGLLAGYMCRHHGVMTDEQLLVGAEGLALLVDAEDMRVAKMKIIRDDSVGPRVMGLSSRFLDRVTKTSPDARKRCQGLLDLVALGKRKKIAALPEETLDRKAAGSGASTEAGAAAAAGGGGGT